MNVSQSPEKAPGNAGGDESLSAQFAGLVLQQTNMALMLLGKSPHPETQKNMLDIDGAKMFIDQLEMLEVKTQGNLKADEAKLLTPASSVPPPEQASTPATEEEARKKFSKKY